MALIDRKAAAKMVNHQLSVQYTKTADGKRCQTWHYGRVELRDLLDAIYGPPNSDDEQID